MKDYKWIAKCVFSWDKLFSVNRNSPWRVTYSHTFFLMTTFMTEYILIKFDSAANSNAGCSCGSAFQQCPPTSPSLCGMLRVPADVRTVLSCSLSNTELAMLLGQCFLVCISGLFSFLSPLKSHFWNAFLLWYRKRLFCESPFFRKWPGSNFQKLSRVPFLKDCVWVTMSYSAVSAFLMCTTPTNSPLLHFKLCDISVNTPSALSLIIASPFVAQDPLVSQPSTSSACSGILMSCMTRRKVTAVLLFSRCWACIETVLQSPKCNSSFTWNTGI